jgi:hypothetical protein
MYKESSLIFLPPFNLVTKTTHSVELFLRKEV